NVDADRVHLLRIADAALAALELGFALRRAHELDFDVLGGEKAFVARDEPRKGKDGASGDIVGDSFRQKGPHARSRGVKRAARVENNVGARPSQFGRPVNNLT